MKGARGRLYLIPNTIDPCGSPEILLPAVALERIRALRRFIVESDKAAWRLLSRVLDAEQRAAVSIERLDEHTKAESLPELLVPALSGEDLGLLSDAGMPCVADPGASLVALAHDRGIPVTALTGPSSVLLALSSSGLDGQKFCFLGYLPPDRSGRRAALSSIDEGIRRDGATRIFIETPYRNASLLEDCLTVFSPDTRLCVAASLTSPSERIRSAPVIEWKSEAWPLGKEAAIFLAGRSVWDLVAPSSAPSGRAPSGRAPSGRGPSGRGRRTHP